MKRVFLPIFFIFHLLIAEDLESILNKANSIISPPNIRGEFNLRLISKAGDTRVFTATAYQKKVNENQENRVFIFTYPASVKDTGLLVHSFFDETDTRMWLYLPVVKRIKRIALESSGGGYFMGSDFTYSDLISRSSDDYTYKREEDTLLNGVSCYNIRTMGATRTKRESIGYSYTTNYYRKSDYLLIGIDYYDLSGDLVKEYRVEKSEILGEYIYPSRVIMTNIQFSHTSIIEFTNLSIESVPDSYFTHLYLKEK